MIECIAPKRLKNGLLVPCGKCNLCKSKRRNEWSIRCAVEVKYCSKMPLFVTLTYNDDFVPSRWHMDCEDVDRGVINAGSSPFTLHRPDVSKFLKRFKRKYDLDDATFHYFGCGEYGDIFGRPHYHLLLFGCDFLDDVFEQSVEKAQNILSELWTLDGKQLGFVHVCRAGYDGIHYVSKYCLKEYDDELDELQVKPFTIVSKNLGASWFKTTQCMHIKRQLSKLCHIDLFDIIGTISIHKDWLKWALDVLSNYVPKFEVELDNGNIVPLPRYFRKRLVGSFQVSTDSPLFVYNEIKRLYDTECFFEKYDGYSLGEAFALEEDKLRIKADRITQRLLRNRKPIKK